MLPDKNYCHLLAESKYVSTGFSQEIAKAAQGKYYYLPIATGSTLAAATSAAMAQAKSGL
jgi:magnesium chelatase subunit D